MYRYNFKPINYFLFIVDHRLQQCVSTFRNVRNVALFHSDPVEMIASLYEVMSLFDSLIYFIRLRRPN